MDQNENNKTPEVIRPMGKDLRTLSKMEFHSQHPVEVTHSEIQTGCMLRMADAMELISKNYSVVVEERNYYKKKSEEQDKFIKELVEQMKEKNGSKAA
jgi:hypothetical protein